MTRIKNIAPLSALKEIAAPEPATLTADERGALHLVLCPLPTVEHVAAGLRLANTIKSEDPANPLADTLLARVNRHNPYAQPSTEIEVSEAEHELLTFIRTGTVSARPWVGADAGESETTDERALYDHAIDQIRERVKAFEALYR